jgi:hypothetical protein
MGCPFSHHWDDKSNFGTTQPREQHISFLPRLSVKKQQALFQLDVTLIPKIPGDFRLTEIQARVRTSVITGQTWVSKTTQKELSKLNASPYPSCEDPMKIVRFIEGSL